MTHGFDIPVLAGGNSVVPVVQPLTAVDPQVAIKTYLASIGRKGGKATSEAKTVACRLNASRPRKRQ